jgi:hypothetical protein
MKDSLSPDNNSSLIDAKNKTLSGITSQQDTRFIGDGVSNLMSNFNGADRFNHDKELENALTDKTISMGDSI